MPEPKKQKDNTSLLEYKVDELQKGQIRQEAKLDSVQRTLDKMNFVKTKDFDEYKSYIEKTFIKKESVKGFKALGWAVATALVISIVFAMAHLLGAKI